MNTVPLFDLQALLTETRMFSVIVIDRGGTILFANAGTSSIFGIDRNAIVSRNYFSLIQTDDVVQVESAVKRGTTEAGDSPIEYRIVHANGTTRWVESLFRTIADGLIVCETHDITLSKITADSMNDSLEWLTSVMDAFRDAIFVEENEHVVFINKAFIRLYGYSSTDEVVGRHVSEFQADEDSVQMLEYSRKRAEGKYAPQGYQFYGRKKDSTYILLEASVSTLHLSGRKIIITVIHDLSDPTLL